ncbi:unnamed protein product [Pedinophyceae sp. YPF-701]|nr:unnamed protein product [Pedinophyceae sp. YPF-701]
MKELGKKGTAARGNSDAHAESTARGERHILEDIAREVKASVRSVTAAVGLLDDGATVPFVARYRTGATGGLTDAQLRDVERLLKAARSLEAKKQEAIQAISKQGKLTRQLEAAIREAPSKAAVVDLQAPYRERRRTKAYQATERGLAPLAEAFLRPPGPSPPWPEKLAKAYVGRGGVASVAEALKGAKDILVEMASESAEARAAGRKALWPSGVLSCAQVKQRDAAQQAEAGRGDAAHKYREYVAFRAPLSSLRGHQILAINRGESAGHIKAKIEFPTDTIAATAFRALTRVDPGSEANGRAPLPASYRDVVMEAVSAAVSSRIVPSLVREARSALKERACHEAAAVFGANARALLLQPPLPRRVVLGIDPGFKSGCKTAAISPTGEVLDVGTFSLVFGPSAQRERALEDVLRVVRARGVSAVAIGNGTASREVEAVLAPALEALKREPGFASLGWCVVSEAGASVWSASEGASQELPHMTASLRGAVSIARRLQDPMAELVKVDVTSLGVGEYQKDLPRPLLSQQLAAVVESAVSEVGADANTASPALLAYVAGVGPKLARTIVAHRDERGPFRRRSDLRAVPGVGPKTFEQLAGFVRVRDSENALDNSAVHPESYALACELVARAGGRAEGGAVAASVLDAVRPALAKMLDEAGAGRAASEGTDAATARQVLEALVRGGADVRGDVPAGTLRGSAPGKLEDVRVGDVVRGTVRNVATFGAFVDVGAASNGLLHVSQLRRLKRAAREADPWQLVAVGDQLELEVVSVDAARGRLGLGPVGGVPRGAKRSAEASDGPRGKRRRV